RGQPDQRLAQLDQPADDRRQQRGVPLQRHRLVEVALTDEVAQVVHHVVDRAGHPVEVLPVDPGGQHVTEHPDQFGPVAVALVLDLRHPGPRRTGGDLLRRHRLGQLGGPDRDVDLCRDQVQGTLARTAGEVVEQAPDASEDHPINRSGRAKTAAATALAGSVTSHAAPIRPAAAQRTRRSPALPEAPTRPPASAWVRLTGAPKAELVTTAVDPANSAATASTGRTWARSNPIRRDTRRSRQSRPAQNSAAQPASTAARGPTWSDARIIGAAGRSDEVGRPARAIAATASIFWPSLAA